MATTPAPFDYSSYANRQLSGADWNTLAKNGINSSMVGKTVNGYTVYTNGAGDVRLKQAATAAPAAAPAPAPAPAPKPATSAAPAPAAGPALSGGPVSTTAAPKPASPVASPAPPVAAAGVAGMDPKWFGTASLWTNPSAAWQRVLAAHSGAMTPEQKAYVQQQIAAGKNAVNPFAAGAGAPAAGAPPGAVGPPAPVDLAGAAKGAQTYSTTPGADPDKYTTNQGTQDVLRNSLIQRAMQGTKIDPNDPTFRQQADTYAAAQERARRNANADTAEALAARGMGGSGAQDVQERMNNESAARASAGFEADLANRELQNRRAEIADALQNLGGLLSQDQQAQLNRELAQLDASLKQASLTQSGQLGNADIALRDKLGMGNLNLGMLQTLLSNKQANNQLGFNIGALQAQLNNSALQSLF